MWRFRPLWSGQDRLSYRKHPIWVRDGRHDPAASEVPRHRRRRPSRLHWCKGRLGVHHDPAWVAHHERNGYVSAKAKQDREAMWLDCVCKHCGKLLDTCWWEFMSQRFPHRRGLPPCPRCAQRRCRGSR